MGKLRGCGAIRTARLEVGDTDGTRVRIGSDRGLSDFPRPDQTSEIFWTSCTNRHVRAVTRTRHARLLCFGSDKTAGLDRRGTRARRGDVALALAAPTLAGSYRQLSSVAKRRFFGAHGMFPGGAERWPRTLTSAARTHPTPSTPRARPMATASSSTRADSRFPRRGRLRGRRRGQARHAGRRVEPIPLRRLGRGSRRALVVLGRIVRAAVRPGPGRRHVRRLHRLRRRQPPRRQRGGQAARQGTRRGGPAPDAAQVPGRQRRLRRGPGSVRPAGARQVRGGGGEGDALIAGHRREGADAATPRQAHLAGGAGGSRRGGEDREDPGAKGARRVFRHVRKRADDEDDADGGIWDRPLPKKSSSSSLSNESSRSRAGRPRG